MAGSSSLNTENLEALGAAKLAELLEKDHPHAARHLHTCHLLASRIGSWGDLIDHRTYAAQLRRDHGRTYCFWSLVPKEAAPESEPVGTRNAAQKDDPREVVSPAAIEGPLQPGLW